MDKYKKYAAAQSAWIEMVNLEVGDVVKVLRSAESHQYGWRNTWVKSEMDIAVGEELVVANIGGAQDTGISLKVSKDNWLRYPFYVLEKVKRKMPDPIVISSNYKASFNTDGSINVGCQHISHELLKKIYETSLSVINK